MQVEPVYAGCRASKDEMEARARFLIAYAMEHGPVMVRGLYYQAEVHGVPGVDKTNADYGKVQHQVLQLRRAGRMPYGAIADATRWMRKPASFDSIEDALTQTARIYRRALWRDVDEYVEIWCEKDALAGVIFPVTEKYDVPLMVARGFASETFAYEAIASREDRRPYVVYYAGDFDRAGQDAARSLREKLTRFGNEAGISVDFNNLAVTTDQISGFNLPTRKPKRVTAADRRWPYDFACELDALPPDIMRELVRHAIERHLPSDQLSVLKVAEESEREIIRMFASQIGGDAMLQRYIHHRGID